MPKDTKTLGNNKARACESLGFVHKKRLCQRFDTTSFRVSLSMAMHLTWWKIHTEIDNRCRRNVIVEKMWRNIGLRNRGNSILVAIYSLLISTFCLFSDAADFT